MRHFKIAVLFAALAAAHSEPGGQTPTSATSGGQTPTFETFETFPAVPLASSKLQLMIMQKGATLAGITLADDPSKQNPLWNPMRMKRELGQAVTYDGGAGHFVCVDGFGAPSAEEHAAGLPFHGEAHAEMFAVSTARKGASTAVTLKAGLAITQEKFTRTFRVIDGENVVHVDSELESLLGFDRPVNWAEHVTIGSPFLEPGVTVVDISGSRSHTRPYPAADNGNVQRRLQGDRDFEWPLAPGLRGETINLRQTPPDPHYLDHAATLVDAAREYGWLTAINPKTRLMLGYVFRRAEYPWIQYWGFYPPTQKMARGIEFSTQPFDVSRREVVTGGTMFGTPLFRWLPAKATIATRFLLFYVRVPEGFDKVDDVQMGKGEIVIRNGAAKASLRLISAEGL